MTIYFYKFSPFLFSFLSTSPLPSITSYSCSHHFTENFPSKSSSWKEFLDSKKLSPIKDNTNHHIKRLKHKLAELVAIIDFHKEKYAEDVFADSFDQLDKELGDLHYTAIIPEEFEMLKNKKSQMDKDESIQQTTVVKIPEHRPGT